MAKPDLSSLLEEEDGCAHSSPSTPLSYNSMKCGSGVGTPVAATPIDTAIEKALELWASNSSASPSMQYPARPYSPKLYQSPAKSLRAATPAASLMSVASSFLDKVLQLALPPQEIKDTRELLNHEYDVSILESDVLVQVIEGARWAGLWDSVATSDDQTSNGSTSPVIPMVDTPTLDVDLYNSRMTYWMLGPRPETPATCSESDLD